MTPLAGLILDSSSDVQAHPILPSVLLATAAISTLIFCLFLLSTRPPCRSPFLQIASFSGSMLESSTSASK